MSQDFKSTKEIFEHLLAGGKIKRASGYQYVVFLRDDGSLSEYGWNFPDHTEWSKHVESKPMVRVYRYDYYSTSLKSWMRSSVYYENDKAFRSDLRGVTKFKRRDEDFIEVESE